MCLDGIRHRSIDNACDGFFCAICCSQNALRKRTCGWKSDGRRSWIQAWFRIGREWLVIVVRKA
eukprot:5254993-Ditylum_brightwellii.AAC.1